MGDRANLAVVENGVIDLRYDHWAATSISFDAFTDGPEPTLQRVRSMMRLDPDDPRSWLDDVWCDGALIIDLDRRELVWLELDLDWLPRVSAYLLEETWPGWTSVWAPSGLRGVLRRLGQTDRLIEDVSESDITIEVIDPAATYAQGTVASVTLVDGRTFAWQCNAGVDALVDLPVDQVLRFVMTEIDAGRIEESGLQRSTPQMRPEGERTNGFHLDVSNREIHWWTLFPYASHGDRLSATWPRWRSVCHGDDFEWHERTAAIGGIRPPLAHDIAAVRDRTQRVLGRPPMNPAIGVARSLSAEGHEARLAPASLAYVPATSRAAVPRVLAALNHLESVGLAELPPCRFLTDEGDVINPVDES